MFLKSLSMKGFKSFADPTVLEFEPGITVVVGPNGSGKSNVVDAVTWVLGAQGPRSLRSAKMEDVIFAGTSSRPALGRAEVSLTIDNASGKLPIDLAEVTITRTLFRSGDSEYAINGAPCRLLDISDLLSDSGVGRQQHMIIGQGQLDTVLNARPEDRRAIIEEAAGVLKHRRRRERAERRLAATAENLERLGDLVREVRRQIRPLERQAAAARSHDTVASELLAVRRYLAGSELAELTTRRRTAAQHMAVCQEEERELHGALEALDAEATSTTAELSSRREEDLARALGAVQGLVERARGTSGVLRERGRAVVAALDAAADVDVVSTLEADAARLTSEIAVADTEDEGAAPERAALAETLQALDAEQSDLRARWASVLGDDLPEEASTKARFRTELLERAAAREQQDIAGLDRRVAALEQRHQAAAVRADLLEQSGAAATENTAALTTALATTTADLEQASAHAEAAQGAVDEAEQARHRTAARAEALERALRDLQGPGGRELLREVDGVVGSLLDLVEIDPGWEAAFEAAAGAGIAAVVVVDGRRSAQAALATLRERGMTGAVLAPRDTTRADPALQLPPGSSAEPVRAHVRARHGQAAAESVLPALLGRAVRVDGWEEAIDLSIARDDLVVVTPEGDRFAATGWRVRSGTGLVTAAAVEEAEARASEAAHIADIARTTLARIAASPWPGPRDARCCGRAGDGSPCHLPGHGRRRSHPHRRGAAAVGRRRLEEGQASPPRRRPTRSPRCGPRPPAWPAACPCSTAGPGRLAGGARAYPPPPRGRRPARSSRSTRTGRRGRTPPGPGHPPDRGRAPPGRPRRRSAPTPPHEGSAWRPRARRLTRLESVVETERAHLEAILGHPAP